jgi:hypothetical protein
MQNTLLVAGVIHLLAVQPISENKPLDGLLLKSTEILEKGLTKEEKEFLVHLPLSCTVQWLQIKKRQVFSGSEFDELCNDPIFWSYANKNFKIVHSEEYFVTVVSVVYYHRLNGKNWDPAMCFDAAAAIAGAPRKSRQSKQNTKPRR